MLSPINFLGCLESLLSFIPHMLISVDYPTFPLFFYLSMLLIGGSSDRFPLLGLQNHCGQWLHPWNQKAIASWQESDDKPRQYVEKQRQYSVDKVPYSQGYGLPSGHVQSWELDRKVGRMLKNWCLWTVVLEKTPESPLDSKEINPECSLEGLMLKLKLHYFGHLMPTDDSLERLGAERAKGIRGRDSRTASPMQWTWTWTNSRKWWGTGNLGMLQSKGLKRTGHDWRPIEEKEQLIWYELLFFWPVFPSMHFPYISFCCYWIFLLNMFIQGYLFEPSHKLTASLLKN